MNKNIILILVLAILAGTAYFLLKNPKDKTTTIDRAESNFKVPTQDIGRILITRKDGQIVDLKRSGERWILNNQYRARQSTMEVLLRGIAKQHLDHIPNQKTTANLLPYFATDGIHVEIFDNQNVKIVGYYVGGTTQTERGTYFIKENSSQPYCLNEPGFDGSLHVRYNLTPEEWRDVRFWNEELAKVDTIKVNYPGSKQESFILYKIGGAFEVTPMFSTTPILKGSPKSYVEVYFNSLEKLACEHFMNDSVERDSILKMIPFMEMDLVYQDKKTYIRFYPKGPVGVSEYAPYIQNYYIDYNGIDFMSGQHEVLKGAFRGYGYFYGK